MNTLSFLTSSSSAKCDGANQDLNKEAGGHWVCFNFVYSLLDVSFCCE